MRAAIDALATTDPTITHRRSAEARWEPIRLVWLSSDLKEFRVDVYPNSAVISLKKAANFASPGVKIKCDDLRVMADARDGDETPYAKITVPRSCMGTPNQVRVSVVGFYDNSDLLDWAPNERQFYPWVNR